MEKFDLDHLYNRLLPRLEVVEQQQLVLVEKLDKLKKICIGVSIAIAIALGYLMGIFWGLLLGAVLGITIYTILYHRMIGDYRKNYKIKVFHELIEELGPNYKYTLDEKLDDQILKNSGIFHEFTKVKCEDLVEGSFDDHSFQMAETNLWYHQRKHDNYKHRDSDTGEDYSYIFKGL